jgi:hypothetical protein
VFYIRIFGPEVLQMGQPAPDDPRREGPNSPWSRQDTEIWARVVVEHMARHGQIHPVDAARSIEDWPDEKAGQVIGDDARHDEVSVELCWMQESDRE